MPLRCLPQAYPLLLCYLRAHSVVYWYVRGPLAIRFTRSFGGELYDAAVSGTVVPDSPLVFLRRVKCLMRRHLARPFSPFLYSMPAHVVVYGYVLGPRAITFENGVWCRGVWLSPVHTPPPLD